LGIPIDYRAPALYLSDIFISLAIVLTLIEYRDKLSRFIVKNIGLIIPALALVIYLFFNSAFSSSDKAASIHFTFKIAEMMLYLLVAILLLSQKNIRLSVQKVLKFTIIWQAAIAILQFTTQQSLGLYILGERAFDVTTSQIAQINLFGVEFLRSYGTFPHPNVLAAFLLVSTVAANLKVNVKVKNNKIMSSFFGDNAVAIFAALGILITFSKTALVLVLLYILFNIKDFKMRILLITLLVLALFIYLRFFTQTYIETVAERILLSQAAINISLQNLSFGVGANNFILHLAKLNLISIGQVRLLQPVHNVFLLILAENGIFGLILFSALLFKVFEKADRLPSIFLSLVLLAYLSIDHFFWTLHQGQMLFFISAALIYNSKKKL